MPRLKQAPLPDTTVHNFRTRAAQLDVIAATMSGSVRQRLRDNANELRRVAEQKAILQSSLQSDNCKEGQSP